MKPRSLWAALALLGTAFAAPRAHASLYWFAGVRSSTPSVCFVGDALTSRSARVQQVLDYLSDYEHAANIRFNYLGTCPAPVTLSNGTEWYGGDIRVVLRSTSVPFTGMVPGKGCDMFLDSSGAYNGDNDGGGSWSNGPDSLAQHRGCVYNLKLGDDADTNGVPWRNHTLHEFGHALGLAHEHARDDVDPACTASNYGGSASDGHITWYDRNSVMHYRFQACGIDGNYGQDGLSAWDRLAVHIMYPEAVHVAEFTGRTVIRTSEPLSLNSLWGASGADLSFAASGFTWKLNGITYSSSSWLSTYLGAANYPFQLSYTDFLGRTYSYSSTVKVLTPADYAGQIVAPVAAQLPLM